MARQLTITLDDATAERLEESRRMGTSVDDAVHEAARDAVRRVLDRLTPIIPRPFVVQSRDLGVPLIDLECTSRALELLDELEGK